MVLKWKFNGEIRDLPRHLRFVLKMFISIIFFK